MGLEVTVCVSTYGSDGWIDLARERAIPSAEALGVPVFHSHGSDLTDARNSALRHVETEWVCFLDADDQLERNYFEHMATGTADVRGPIVRFVRDSAHWRMWQPRVAGHQHDCTAECLREGNWLVIGALVRAEMVREVGGFRDFPWSEDWDLWLRCWEAGATFELISLAHYIAYIRDDSRNRAPDRAAKLAAHQAIYDANAGFLEAVETIPRSRG